MSISFKGKNGNIIVYSSGMINDDAIDFLKKRIVARARKIDQRAWIVKEYESLVAKQKLDLKWIDILQSGSIDLSNSEE